jgi:eukaryotic-like serine/threonine-protein kinase
MTASPPADDELAATAAAAASSPSDAGLAAPGDDLLARGTRAGGYVIEEVVSQGGFASVYRARHAQSGRRAALKVLWRDLAAQERVVARFQHEARALLRLRHPNIVEILDSGRLDDGRPYFAMEWLGWRNLRDLIRARGPLGAAEALAVAEEIVAGLRAAHQAGIVHRDLKTQNVMVVPRGDGFGVKLVDFGIAKVLEPDKVGLEDFVTGTTILGTPFYMAPEQILGRPVDRRTDIYALGLLLYELVTGEAAFRAETRAEVERMHLEAPPPRASASAPVGAAFDAVIARCLEKAPARRYPDVDALLADLRVAVTGQARP